MPGDPWTHNQFNLAAPGHQWLGLAGWAGWLGPPYCIPWLWQPVPVLHSVPIPYMTPHSHPEQYSRPYRAHNLFALFLTASSLAVLVYPVQLRLIAAVTVWRFV